jgi:DegV family protein with EDD domain
MAKTIILTDSASDISSENEQRYAQTLRILPFQIILGDRSYTSRVDFDNEQFYQMMDGFDGFPTTSQITAFEFEELYGSLAAEGYTDAILVLINSKGSATYENAVFARQTFMDAHPELSGSFRVQLVDGASYTGAYGYPVVEAARMAQEGVSPDEIVRFVQDWVDHAVIYFGMYSLKYASKSGRIPSAAAFVGEAIGLKAIMRIFDHQIVTAAKVRGEKNIIPTVLEKTVAEIEPGTPYCIVYGSDSAARDAMAAALTEALGYPPVDSYQIGAAVACNAGSRVVGSIFRGK